MNRADLLKEVRRWLRYAQEDLKAAEELNKEGQFITRHVCWFSQQA